MIYTAAFFPSTTPQHPRSLSLVYLVCLSYKFVGATHFVLYGKSVFYVSKHWAIRVIKVFPGFVPSNNSNKAHFFWRLPRSHLQMLCTPHRSPAFTQEQYYPLDKGQRPSPYRPPVTPVLYCTQSNIRRTLRTIIDMEMPRLRVLCEEICRHWKCSKLKFTSLKCRLL